MEKKYDRLCREIRIDIIRMLSAAGSGHPGGSLSEVEILVALFFRKMRHDPANPFWPERDRFVLSKGHGVPALYAVLARCGYIPSGDFMSLRKIGSRFQGHPDRFRFPFLEVSSGSLGQGLSVAQGFALASRLDGTPYRVYCLMGDGEIQEGQVWEAAMSAAKFRLGHLTAIVDANGGQIDGFVKDVMELEPLIAKWRAFRWHVLEVDGHDLGGILGALEESEKEKDRPSLIVARTVKGKGVSFMENRSEWHGKAPTEEQAALAIKELEEGL